MKLLIEDEKCKQCLLCVESCSKKLLDISKKTNSMGYHPVYLTDEDKCSSCSLCAIMCPDTIIQVN